MTQMRYHPVLGERILDSVPSLERLVRDVVRSHHERWDGHGYPDGLVGAQIPLAARIFAVVDAFDAMTNDRPYRLASSIEAASTEIRACAGTHFDPLVAEAFCELVPGAQEAA
jgi:HD-GYP domain-containing protein (c-di-GMP phosphodiesterase class II)